MITVIKKNNNKRKRRKKTRKKKRVFVEARSWDLSSWFAPVIEGLLYVEDFTTNWFPRTWPYMEFICTCNCRRTRSSIVNWKIYHIMPLGLVALAEALVCSIEKTWKLNIQHLLSVLFLFVDSQFQPRMVSHMLYFSINYSALLEPLVCASGKLLLTGDLNFHVNNPSEGNAYQFVDVLSCFNLNALNVNIPIHKLK